MQLSTSLYDAKRSMRENLPKGLRVAYRSTNSFRYSLQFHHHNHQLVMIQNHINKRNGGAGETLPGNGYLLNDMNTCGMPSINQHIRQSRCTIGVPISLSTSISGSVNVSVNVPVSVSVKRVTGNQRISHISQRTSIDGIDISQRISQS